MTDKREPAQGTALIGIGGCGCSMLENWQDKLPEEALCIAVDRDKREFIASGQFEHRIILTNVKSKASTVEYAESVRNEVEGSLEKHLPALDQVMNGRVPVILLAGLGGVIGTWGSQLLCNHLTARNRAVVTVLVMPFGFERERVKVAEAALSGFDGAAHRVLCFNDYLIKHAPEGTSMQDAFEIMNTKAFELMSFP